MESYAISSMPIKSVVTNLVRPLYINNIIMVWEGPQCIHDLNSVVIEANTICYCTEIIFPFVSILLSPEVPHTVSGRDSFL